MRIVIGNTASRIVVGGKDHLLPVDLFKEIDEYLSVKTPGAQYSKAYKMGKWDGMRRFMNKDGVFATGFLPMLMKYAEELGAVVELQDQRINVPRLVEQRERVWNHYRDWEARDYQKDIVNAYDNWLPYGDFSSSIYWPRGIANAATNAGKNSVICCLLKNIEKPKALVLIDSQEIFDQLVEFLSVDFKVGMINAKNMMWGEEVTVAMVRTLHSRMKKSIDAAVKVQTGFNTIIVDECHGAGAATSSELIQSCDAGMRVFVSGSPLDSSNVINNMVILGLSGPIVSTITKKELQDMGHSLKIKVTLHHNNTLYEGGDADDYPMELAVGVCQSVKRAKIILDIIKKRPGKKFMINFVEIEHGEFMYNYLKGAGVEKLDWVHGTDTQRKKKLERYKAGEIMIMISSTIFKQGINVPDINVLIHAQAGKAIIALKQWTGRIERNDGVSDSVEVHDFWDNGKYLEKHSRKRINFYHEEGFEITYNYAQKRGRPVEAAQTKLDL